jgi:glutamine cyclotransferase
VSRSGSDGSHGFEGRGGSGGSSGTWGSDGSDLSYGSSGTGGSAGPGGSGGCRRPRRRSMQAFAGLLAMIFAARADGVGPARATTPAAAGAQAPAGGSAAQSAGAAAPRQKAAPAPARPAQHLVVKVLSVRPHDASAYTQGLVWDHGTLYESAGLYGQSSLREVDPRTGVVKRQLSVPNGFFAEGLAQAGNRLIQLTWKEGVAFVYDARSFERISEYRYDGEGWGLCNDGRRLVMSDGSDRLTFRDLKTFAVTGSVAVRRDGMPLRELNELECVDGAVWANVWMTDEIVRIDPESGQVTAVVEARGLLSAEEMTHADVLNGIAWDPAKKTFLITGKLWPRMFEVVFVPAGPAGPAGPSGR